MSEKNPENICEKKKNKTVLMLAAKVRREIFSLLKIKSKK